MNIEDYKIYAVLLLGLLMAGLVAFKLQRVLKKTIGRWSYLVAVFFFGLTFALVEVAVLYTGFIEFSR